MTTTQGGIAQRQHILDVALSLMAQRGVDGTSMRDLAGAAGLNVASLYHYFPSKRDLLVAVLEERGLGVTETTWDQGAEDAGTAGAMTAVIDDMLRSMLEVEDFVRLMLGEVMRGEETALTVGRELLDNTQSALAGWLLEHQAVLAGSASPDEAARLIRATIVGLFFEHVAGVLDDTPAGIRERAGEIARLICRPGTSGDAGDAGDAGGTQ